MLKFFQRGNIEQWRQVRRGLGVQWGNGNTGCRDTSVYNERINKRIKEERRRRRIRTWNGLLQIVLIGSIDLLRKRRRNLSNTILIGIRQDLKERIRCGDWRRSLNAFDSTLTIKEERFVHSVRQSRWSRMKIINRSSREIIRPKWKRIIFDCIFIERRGTRNREEC